MISSTQRCWLLALLLIVSSSIATAETNEKILVPVFSHLARPIGSWITVVALLNNSSIPISTPGVEFTIRCSGPSFMGGCSSNNVPANSVGSLASPTSAAGIMLEVPAIIAEHLFFSAHVGSATRQIPLGGSELPIVRQHEFKPRLDIPYIPLRAPSPRLIRVHLRIYSLDAAPVSGRILLRSFDGTPFFGSSDERDFSLGEVAPPAPPRFALYDLQELYPAAPTGGLYRLVIEAAARSDGTVPTVWALVSATDVTTQEVTLYRAQ